MLIAPALTPSTAEAESHIAASRPASRISFICSPGCPPMRNTQEASRTSRAALSGSIRLSTTWRWEKSMPYSKNISYMPAESLSFLL